ncbi:hypothetical protein VPH35_102106 [Triticum aestivum]
MQEEDDDDDPIHGGEATMHDHLAAAWVKPMAMWARRSYSRSWAATGTARAGAPLQASSQLRDAPSAAMSCCMARPYTLACRLSSASRSRSAAPPYCSRQWSNRARSAPASASSSARSSILASVLAAWSTAILVASTARPWIPADAEASALRASAFRDRTQWS